MKKIGILTINDYSNYGNRLQNYALQELLKSLGFNVDTIVNLSNETDPSEKSIIEKVISKSPKEMCKLIKEKIHYKFNKKEIDEIKNKKIISFKKFTKKHISEYAEKIEYDNIPKELNEKFDFFVTGSDQVWNPNYRNGSNIDFLTFADKKKRISYAPSFGIADIPDEYKLNYKTWINEMNHLSVREEAGAKIIKDLTGRDVSVVLDPTMMISRENWLSIASESYTKPKSKYLLTYFLGNITKEYKKFIEDISIENNLEIVNLGDINDKERYSVDPGEFIDYINSASVFFTDSFHGAVFSILLRRPFVVMERVEYGASMGSRIDTLLNKFNLTDRKWSRIGKSADIFNVKYDNIDEILGEEQKKSLEYLKKALV